MSKTRVKGGNCPYHSCTILPYQSRTMPNALCQSRLYHSVPHHSGTIQVPFPYQLSDTVCFLAVDWTYLDIIYLVDV